jgi:hypothetical protein
MSTASEPRMTFRLAGVLLAVGCAIFAVGVLRYALLPSDLGLPADQSSYQNALKEATSRTAEMMLAGKVIFFGDLLVAAAALALLSRRRYVGVDLERVGWALVFVSFLPAFVFDSLMGSALPHLATDAPGSFVAFKSWFDFQFAAGNIPFGIGAALVFLADARSPGPTLPSVVDYLAIAVCCIALIGGLGYVLGLFVGWQLNGPPLLLAAIALGALGIQIARRERAGME